MRFESGLSLFVPAFCGPEISRVGDELVFGNVEPAIDQVGNLQSFITERLRRSSGNPG